MSTPLCPHCKKPMIEYLKQPSGSVSYYCACRGQITWSTQHPVKEIPLVKRTGTKPE